MYLQAKKKNQPPNSCEKTVISAQNELQQAVHVFFRVSLVDWEREQLPGKAVFFIAGMGVDDDFRPVKGQGYPGIDEGIPQTRNSGHEGVTHWGSQGAIRQLQVVDCPELLVKRGVILQAAAGRGFKIDALQEPVGERTHAHGGSC